MRRSVFAILGLIGLCASAAAYAQADPSADDIFNSLKPTKRDLTGPVRGIVPARTQDDTPAPAPRLRAVHRAGYSPRAASVAPDHDLKSIAMAIDFVTGSAALTPHATHQLDQLGEALTRPGLQTARFRIEGHTDTVGTPEYNKDLSVQRAQAVTAYLEQKFGVDAARMEPVGLGTAQLIVPTPDQTPEPRNRRVRIVNLDS